MAALAPGPKPTAEIISALVAGVRASILIAAIAIIFAAYMLLRPGWKFGLRKGCILSALIADLLCSWRVFEPTALRRAGPLVEPGKE